MQPRITVLTLGVSDLDRAVAFYRDGLGLPTEGIMGTQYEHGAVAFFELQGGLTLALWPRDNIAHDTGLPKTGPSPTDVTIGHNVGSQAEVDAIMTSAQKAGAPIVKPAQQTFYGGYADIFRTPMGICGKWRGIRIGRPQSRNYRSSITGLVHLCDK